MDLGLLGWLCGLVDGAPRAFRGMSKGPAKRQVLAGDLFLDFDHGWRSGTLVANLVEVIYDV